MLDRISGAHNYAFFKLESIIQLVESISVARVVFCCSGASCYCILPVELAEKFTNISLS